MNHLLLTGGIFVTIGAMIGYSFGASETRKKFDKSIYRAKCDINELKLDNRNKVNS